MWCVLTWHFPASHTNPLVLSVLEMDHLRVSVPACVHLCTCHVLMCAYMWIWGTFALPSYPSSHTRITLYVIPQSHRQGGSRERELLRKVHLVSWQHSNYKLFETLCIERIILNYSELKFKFHFVLALSNGQNCLGEISKGQGGLKCLL